VTSESTAAKMTAASSRKSVVTGNVLFLCPAATESSQYQFNSSHVYEVSTRTTVAATQK